MPCGCCASPPAAKEIEDAAAAEVGTRASAERDGNVVPRGYFDWIFPQARVAARPPPPELCVPCKMPSNGADGQRKCSREATNFAALWLPGKCLEVSAIMPGSCCRTGLLSVGFVCRSIKNFDKAALNGTLETLSNRLIMAANRKTGCTLAGGQKTVRRSPGRVKGL